MEHPTAERTDQFPSNFVEQSHVEKCNDQVDGFGPDTGSLDQWEMNDKEKRAFGLITPRGKKHKTRVDHILDERESKDMQNVMYKRLRPYAHRKQHVIGSYPIDNMHSFIDRHALAGKNANE